MRSVGIVIIVLMLNIFITGCVGENNGMANKSNGYGANVMIKSNPIYNQVGASLSTTTDMSFGGQLQRILGWSIAPPYHVTLPDHDLHAFTQDGRHVGVNYTTGDYENQIESATASGDMLDGVEWIFVPENEKVMFKVSNHDTGEFLKEHPEAADLMNDTRYNLNIYYEDNKSNRYYSGVRDQQIKPGEDHDYFFNVGQKPDGTYEIMIK